MIPLLTEPQKAFNRLQVLPRAQPASAYPPLTQGGREYDGAFPTKPDRERELVARARYGDHPRRLEPPRHRRPGRDA